VAAHVFTDCKELDWGFATSIMKVLQIEGESNICARRIG